MLVMMAPKGDVGSAREHVQSQVVVLPDLGVVIVQLAKLVQAGVGMLPVDPFPLVDLDFVEEMDVKDEAPGLGDSAIGYGRASIQRK